jgi:hypothetical protein
MAADTNQVAFSPTTPAPDTRRLLALPIALVTTAALLGIFTLATGFVLAFGGHSAFDQGVCDMDTVREIRRSGDTSTVDPGDIHGMPPSRVCHAYISRRDGPGMILVDEQEFPGPGWYEIGLLLVASPLLLVGAARGVQALRHG